MFHMLLCSKRENVDVDENLPGSTTPCMGTAEKAASSRGVRGDLGPTPCSMSRWLKVVDGVKGSSGRREGMATPQVPRALNSFSAGWQRRNPQKGGAGPFTSLDDPA